MKSFVQKFPILEFLFLIIFVLLMNYILFMEPITGLADTGDYFRIMSRSGITYLTDSREERYFYYINRYYGYSDPKPVKYYSSELYLVKTAILLDNLFTRDDRFSLVSIGAVHAFLYLAALGIIVFTFRCSHLLIRLICAKTSSV